MRNFLLGFLVATLLLGASYYAWVTRQEGAATTQAPARIQKYYCPMHPDYVVDQPGDCPICNMKLEPLPEPNAGPTAGTGTTGGSGESSGAAVDQPSGGAEVQGRVQVKISPERLQLMGVTLDEARVVNLEDDIRTVGRVAVDETRLHHVHTKFEGYIESLYADSVGMPIAKGQPLFSVYSPDLVATQKEYLLALKARKQFADLDGAGSGSGIDFLGAARERLSLWDISGEQLARVEQTGEPIRALTIYSPASGFVAAKTALAGLRVTPADTLYEIVDLSWVWVLVDVYESQLGMVRLGQPAEMTLSYLPGRRWRGRVSYIYPTLDEKTRTARVRMEVPNENGQLKPEMYADVELRAGLGKRLAVPESALVETGERSLVFVVAQEGVFEPREITPGFKVRNLVEVRAGLRAGERVVVGANFLLDSESKLKAALSSRPSRPRDQER